jgi:RHS repeat-associated protein
MLQSGHTYYELSNHLGNVLVTVTDMKIGIEGGTNWVAEYYEATVVSAVDYYPFGSGMAGRKYNDDSYRYGFNGMEKDDEMKGNGNSYDFGARLYDSRIGRFLSIDPYSNYFSSTSDYIFAANTPIMAIDYDGKFPIPVITAIAGGVVGLGVGLYQRHVQGKAISNKEIMGKVIGGAVTGFVAGTGVGLIGLAGGAGTALTATAAEIALGTTVISHAGAVMTGMFSSIIGGAVGNLAEQGYLIGSGAREEFDEMDFVFSVALSIPGEIIGGAGSQLFKQTIGELTEEVAMQGLKQTRKAMKANSRKWNDLIKENGKKIREVSRNNGVAMSKNKSKEIAEQALRRMVKEGEETVQFAIEKSTEGFSIVYSIGIDVKNDEIKENVTQD